MKRLIIKKMDNKQFYYFKKKIEYNFNQIYSLIASLFLYFLLSATTILTILFDSLIGSFLIGVVTLLFIGESLTHIYYLFKEHKLEREFKKDDRQKS